MNLQTVMFLWTVILCVWQWNRDTERRQPGRWRTIRRFISAGLLLSLFLSLSQGVWRKNITYYFLQSDANAILLNISQCSLFCYSVVSCHRTLDSLWWERSWGENRIQSDNCFHFHMYIFRKFYAFMPCLPPLPLLRYSPFEVDTEHFICGN